MHIVGVQDIWTDGEVDGFITPSPHNIYIYTGLMNCWRGYTIC